MKNTNDVNGAPDLDQIGLEIKRGVVTLTRPIQRGEQVIKQVKITEVSPAVCAD